MGDEVRDLRIWFREVQRRPQMYLNNKSLHELETMCWGYQTALSFHNIEEFGTSFTIRFSEFLREHHGISDSLPWAEIIRATVADDEAAFQRFFELLAEFEATEAEQSDRAPG